MYRVFITRDALNYLVTLTEKSKRLINRRFAVLKEDPYPGRADKKKLHLPGYDLFRMHVCRSYTIFDRIEEQEKIVKIIRHHDLRGGA